MMIAQPLLWAGVFSRSSHACTKCPPCKKIVGLHIGRAGASSLQDGALHRRRCAGSALLCRRVLPKFDTRPATSQRRCRSSPAPKGKNGWGYVVRIGAISISISISLYLYISISLYLYLYIYISIYLYIYISIYLYIYISTYLHIYISTSRSRSRSRSISISISIFFLRLRHGPGGVPGPLHGEESLHLCAGDPGASAGVCHVGPSAPTAVAGLHRQRRRPVGPDVRQATEKKDPAVNGMLAAFWSTAALADWLPDFRRVSKANVSDAISRGDLKMARRFGMDQGPDAGAEHPANASEGGSP